MPYTNDQIREMAFQAEQSSKDSKTPRTDTQEKFQAALGTDFTLAHKDTFGLCRDLERELAAWKARFPQYKFRPQDDGVFLE